ncbi:hypothetical protein HPP92_010212 [Vanilla planifolia]|uniref:tRNA (guanine-N(7)-)-methyltransferase n=1 Tax=Vanilla planifolia TaxID=51239 RepID=A0A835R1Y5_VANPL|nr:hypothetical protein HPP92_010212 [Vanilla planifolia]
MSMKDSKTTGGNGQSVRLPRKRFYRARAHSNPLSDSHFPIPISPSDIDYSPHYPRFFDSKHDEHDKETLMIGMELRDKVTEYVKERILALRASNPGQYDNISVVRTKSMKYLPNYFCKGQLSKMFFLFPHPHFKEKNHRRRVCLCPGSWRPYLYNNTDVEELGDWIKSCMESHPLFIAVSDEELEADPVVPLLSCATEDGQKVARNGGRTFRAVYRRISSGD